LPCSSNCRTQDHKSWGECVRSKGLQIADVGAHMASRSQSADIKSYVDARAAGLQPESVSKASVESAWRATEATGTPYRADKL